MLSSLRHVTRVLWVIVILLGIGGQGLHACADPCEAACPIEHAESERETGESSTTDAGSTHHCCLAHVSGHFLLSDCALELVGNRLTGVLTLTVAAIPESPVREIEYPPQLS